MASSLAGAARSGPLDELSHPGEAVEVTVSRDSSPVAAGGPGSNRAGRLSTGPGRSGADAGAGGDRGGGGEVVRLAEAREPRGPVPPRGLARRGRGDRVVGAAAAIALNTFREATRDRILYLILAVALVLIALARLVSMWRRQRDQDREGPGAFGDLDLRIAHDGLRRRLPRVQGDRAADDLHALAQPVRRWQFVVGKYLGLLLVLATSVGVTGTALLAAVALKGEAPWPLLPAIALIFVELALVAAFAVLFSSFTNPILAAVGTFATYVAGHLTWSFDLLAKRMTSSTGKALCAALHAVLPNLDRLDIKAAAVHGVALAPGTFAAAVAYGAC